MNGRIQLILFQETYIEENTVIECMFQPVIMDRYITIINISLALQFIDDQDQPTDCWPHVLCPQPKINHSTSLGVTCDQRIMSRNYFWLSITALPLLISSYPNYYWCYIGDNLVIGKKNSFPKGCPTSAASRDWAKIFLLYIVNPRHRDWKYYLSRYVVLLLVYYHIFKTKVFGFTYKILLGPKLQQIYNTFSRFFT